MISDNELHQALQDYESEVLSRLPEEEPAFSPEFLKKMENISAGKHRSPGRLRRIAASFAAVCCAFSLLTAAVSPEVRASVISWIRGQEDTYFTYRSSGASEHTESLIYGLTSVAEGYTLFADHSEPGNGVVIYVNEAGQLLSFQYSADSGNSALYLDPESGVHSGVTVHDAAADLYLAQAEDESSAIVWVDPQSDYLLTVSGFFSEAELIELAESAAILP